MTLVVLPANHWLWYLAQISLGASFIAPSVVVLRLLLATGFTCLFIWSIAVLKVSVDSAVFAGCYLLINFGVFLGLLWRMRHVKFDVDREAVYTRYFEADAKGHKKPFNLSRAHWQAVNEESEIVTIPAGEIVVKSGDRCDSVTFLLSGKLSYFHELDNKEGKELNQESRRVMHAHGVAQMGVVDAVEWVHRDTPRGPVWGISVRAVESVRLLRLKYTAIDRASNNYREAAIMPLFNSICGIQVAQLLFDAENERIADYGKSTSPSTTTAPQQNVIIDIAPINSNQQQLKTSNTEMVRWHVE